MRTRLDEIVEEEWGILFPGSSIGPSDNMRAKDQRIAERAFRHGVEQGFNKCSGNIAIQTYVKPEEVQPAPAEEEHEHRGYKCTHWNVFDGTEEVYWLREGTVGDGYGYVKDERHGERRKITPWTRERYGRREYWGWVDGEETESGYDRRTGKDRRK